VDAGSGCRRATGGRWGERCAGDIKATINGKRFKGSPKFSEMSAGGGTIGFLATGIKYGGGRRNSKVVMISCVNDLSVQAFPFTSTNCLATYFETGIRAPVQKIWNDIRVPATEVTFDSYEPGVRVAGRFHAVVAGFSDPDLQPLTIDGEFQGPVKLGDPTR
jgi:hypothetical protein